MLKKKKLIPSPLEEYNRAFELHPKKAKKWCLENDLRPGKLRRRLAGEELSSAFSQRLAPGRIMMLRNNAIAVLGFGVLSAKDKQRTRGLHCRKRSTLTIHDEGSA